MASFAPRPKASILKFQEGQVERLKIKVPREVRWVASNRFGQALLVGNRGLILLLVGERLEVVESPIKENLRGAAFTPDGTQALVVGNKGTVLKVEGKRVFQLWTEAEANLRRVDWTRDGSAALVVGNDGTILSWNKSSFTRIQGALNNLRAVRWHPDGSHALISGNYFATSMIPSSPLYRFVPGEDVVSGLEATEKTDLIAVDWRPQGDFALVVGYELVWQEPRIFRWKESRLERVPLTANSIYPTAVAWHPNGEYALIGTGSPYTNEESPHTKGIIYRFSANGTSKVYEEESLRIPSIAWEGQGKFALLVASSVARTFSS